MTDKTETDPFEVAFTAAQGEMKDAVFNRVNPHFKSKYADRAALGKATKPALTDSGMNIRHRLGWVEQLGYCVITRLSHVSGKYEESFWQITGTTPQQRGSDITYGCRYNTASLCNVASDDDDDGNEAETLRRAENQKSAYRARKDGDDEAYKKLSDEMRSKESKDDLREWGLSIRDIVAEWPDGWQKHFRDEYERTMQGLAA